MKALLNRLVIVLVALTLVGAAVPAAAQQASYYNPRQIERDVAPIALYPDQLLTQILMAATYPLEVGEAADWARDPRNAGRRGDDLAYALDQFDWDPSVKALVPFPRILEMLDSQPDWMDRLGEAFLAQEGDVMDAVQRLRAQAYAAGTLRGDGRLAVRYDGPSIVIGPAVPDEVYVPYYDPRVAYGDWAYPDEPPIYFPPPADYAYTYPAPVFGLAFFAPTPIVRPLWGWCDWDWGRRRVVIVRERYIVINRHREPHFAGDYWQHDWYHRRGAPYRAVEAVRRFERGDFGPRDFERERRFEFAARQFAQRSDDMRQRRERQIDVERRQLVDIQRRRDADQGRDGFRRPDGTNRAFGEPRRFERPDGERFARERDPRLADRERFMQQLREQRQQRLGERDPRFGQDRAPRFQDERSGDQRRFQDQGRERFQQERAQREQFFRQQQEAQQRGFQERTRQEQFQRQQQEGQQRAFQERARQEQFQRQQQEGQQRAFQERARQEQFQRQQQEGQQRAFQERARQEQFQRQQQEGQQRAFQERARQEQFQRQQQEAQQRAYQERARQEQFQRQQQEAQQRRFQEQQQRAFQDQRAQQERFQRQQFQAQREQQQRAQEQQQRFQREQQRQQTVQQPRQNRDERERERRWNRG